MKRILQVLPPGFTIGVDIDRLLKAVLPLCAALYRYGHIQPSEVDRMTISHAEAVLSALKHLIGKEERSRMDAQQELVSQASLQRKF